MQQLGGLKLGLQKAIPSNLESKKLLNLLDVSTQELRELSHRMMPRSLQELGLVAAMKDMLNNSLGHSQIEFDFEHHGFEQRLEEHVEVTLFRIAQELINNVSKHSGASLVNVQLISMNNDAILIVEDNGHGFQSNTKTNGIGLMNISSRLDTLNGKVSYDASPEGGTLATIRIPLKPQRTSSLHKS